MTTGGTTAAAALSTPGVTTALWRGHESAAGAPTYPRLRLGWIRAATPAGMTLAVVITGMLVSFLWPPLVNHRSHWMTPGDGWATLRGAHYVAWGALGDVYSSGTALVTLPAILVVLAPVAALCSTFGLSEGFPLPVAHPTAWLVLGPVTLALSFVAMAGLDRLAAELGIGASRRRALLVAEAAACWTTVAVWGHPEDLLSLGLAALALASATRQRWVGAAWLLGVAVAFQPLAVLLVPLLLAAAPAGRRLGTAIRMILPAAVLVGVVFSADFRDAWTALTRQPNYPTVDHPTIWMAFSPRLSATAVAAGPTRMVAVAIAVALGLRFLRHRPRPEQLAAAAAVVLAARCFFEAVMVPFYVTPAVALALVVAARGTRRRMAAAAAAGGLLCLMTNLRAGPALWWVLMTALLLGVLIFSGAAEALLAPAAVPKKILKVAAARRRYP